MSGHERPAALNWREIDAVLEELPLSGSFVRGVWQPHIRELTWEMYSPRGGGRWWLLTSFHERFSRLHPLEQPPPRPTKTQRFASFLRAHVVGGRIVSASQLPGNRIVRVELARGGASVVMWWRLWASASNCVVTDADRRVLDALLRRPGRDEVSGGALELPDAAPADSGKYRVRELPGEGSYGERLARHFAAAEALERRQAEVAAHQRALQDEEERLARLAARLDEEVRATADHARLRELGDVILSHLAAMEPGDRWLRATDYASGGQVEVELQPLLDGPQNAQRYFDRAKQQRRRYDAAASRKRDAAAQLDRIREALQDAETAPEETLASDGGSGGGATSAAAPAAAHAGITARSGAFTIVVGRNARESDQLLRTMARGNDTWLHCRDAPGGHVFVRAVSGQTVPLETLLDAGNLAVFYSRARASGRADVYYTQVKHLRRVRGGAAGRVIPSQEKNLDIRLDQARIDRLLGDRLRR